MTPLSPDNSIPPPVVPILHGANNRRHLAAKLSVVRCIGDFPMVIILHELLVFSCLAAFVTGIVIAAASLL